MLLKLLVSVTAVVLAILSALDVVVSSPLPVAPSGDERWENPCGGSHSITSGDSFASLFEDLVIPTIPPLNVATNLEIKSQEGYAMAEDIRHIYATERIEDSVIQANLDEYNLPGFPEITMTQQIIVDTINDPLQAHLANFRKLSIAAVFLEQTLIDEDFHENGQYSLNISLLEEKIYSILCELDLAIKEAGGEIDEHVTQDAMSLELRSITQTSRRYERDYIAMKDIAELIDTFVIQYGAWKLSLTDENDNTA